MCHISFLSNLFNFGDIANKSLIIDKITKLFQLIQVTDEVLSDSLTCEQAKEFIAGIRLSHHHDIIHYIKLQLAHTNFCWQSEILSQSVMVTSNKWSYEWLHQPLQWPQPDQGCTSPTNGEGLYHWFYSGTCLGPSHRSLWIYLVNEW